MWMATYEVIQDGCFSEKEQKKMAEMFGFELIERIKGFLSDIPAADVHDVVHERMAAAREELESLIPTSFDTEIKGIQERVSSRFDN
jgi:hypothetical protein